MPVWDNYATPEDVALAAARAVMGGRNLRSCELEAGLYLFAPSRSFNATDEELARDSGLWEAALVAVEGVCQLRPAAWKAAATESDFLSEVFERGDGTLISLDRLYQDSVEEERSRAVCRHRVWLVLDDQGEDSAIYPLLWLAPEARSALSELDHELARHLSDKEDSFYRAAANAERHRRFTARLREERVLEPVKAESRGRVSGLGD